MKEKRRRQIRASVVYTLLSAFLYAFYRIYIHFSFGQDSAYMHYMFLIPLCGGLFPALLILLFQQEGKINRIPFNLYNSALACFVIGCLVKGIITISGRYTNVEQTYFIVGGIFLALSVILSVIFALSSRPSKVTSD